MSLQHITGTPGSGPGKFITDALNTRMTRREFLTMGCALLISVAGIQNFVSVISRHTGSRTHTPQTADGGFGARSFGG